MSDVEGIRVNAASVRGRIAEAARRAGREPDAVTLVAVTKTFPTAVCRDAVAAGLIDLGENYVKELREKAASVRACWHYLGPVQTHTANAVADLADLVHGLGSLSAARRLSGRCERSARTLDVLIQVDLADRGTAVVPEDVGSFADQVAALRGLRLRGLMTIPPPTQTAEAARPYFRQLADLRERLAVRFPELKELSMGMSMDYEVAVEEGATMVRVGTALFGERRKR